MSELLPIPQSIVNKTPNTKSLEALDITPEQLATGRVFAPSGESGRVPFQPKSASEHNLLLKNGHVTDTGINLSSMSFNLRSVSTRHTNGTK